MPADGSARAAARGKIARRGAVALVVPYQRMDDDEVWAFLAGSPGEPAHTGKLATTRQDGSPHVAPIWYAVDDRSVVFNTGRRTMKGRNLFRDPRAALCVDDERPPFAFVILEARVEISEDPVGLLRWATIIGGRYMGAERAEGYGKRNAVAGELLVRLRPSRITSASGVADELI